MNAYTVDTGFVKEGGPKPKISARSGAPLQGLEFAEKLAIPARATSSGLSSDQPVGLDAAEKVAVPPQTTRPQGGPPDTVKAVLQAADGPDTETAIKVAEFEGSKFFRRMVFGIQVVVVVVLITLQLAQGSTLETSLGGTPSAKDSALSLQLYNYYIGVALMMFIGFGYLMTFLRWYGLGAVGLTMIITCLGVEVYLIFDTVRSFFAGNGGEVVVDLSALLQANFAVAAFLISFGGLIGKVNPCQLLVLVVFEAVFYGVNKLVMEDVVGISDVGGTIIIHMFGAYYGLAAAWYLGQPAINIKEKASYTSDLFSLLGTIVLWVYWPSFVAGATPAGTPDAELQLVQTILALVAATVTTFALSAELSEQGKLRPVDVQNATLAGGVSIGILAGTPLTAAGAILVGSFAGALSTFGFAKVSVFLYDKIGLHDTCGIHNLHGMPSMMGALISVVIPNAFPGISSFVPRVQLMGIAITLATAIVTGLLTGRVMAIFADNVEMASDAYYWEVADDFALVPEKDELDVLKESFKKHKEEEATKEVLTKEVLTKEVLTKEEPTKEEPTKLEA